MIGCRYSIKSNCAHLPCITPRYSIDFSILALALNLIAMEYRFLFWLYTILAILLVNHRADSAYFHEWELVTKRHTLHIGLYVAVHLAGLILLTTGFILLYQENNWGTYWAIAECILCWSLLVYHRTNKQRKKDDEYSDLAGKATLVALIATSAFLFGLSIYSIANR